MSAVERGRNERRGAAGQRENAPYLIKLLCLHATARCSATPRHAGNLSPFVAGIAGGATDLTYILHT
jgi:hypothetical protein